MPTYSYTAVDQRGQQKSGTIDANDTTDATNQIKQLGFFPTRLSEATKEELSAAARGQDVAGARTRKKKGGRIGGRTLTVFTRQLATLIDAGLPLLRALKTLIRQEKNPTLKAAMNDMAYSVESGSTFSESLAQHPRIFNKLYINMVKAGELGGVLEIVLARLAEFMEKAEKIKAKVISAMVYPVVVLFIAIVILIFLLIFIVPQFQNIFEEMLPDKDLPALTLGVIAVSDFVQNQWYWLLGGIAVIYIGYLAFAASTVGALILDRFKLNAPVFGDLIRKTAIARFSRTLGTLVSSGVPILQALNITKETAGNVLVGHSIAKIHDSVREGETIVTPMEGSGIFPPMVVSMVQVGEETGQLPDMLIKVADVYDEEVDVKVAGLTSLLEPIMIVGLAVIVGTIVIALFLPLIEIIQGLNAR
ncbi:MAG: type II secretion system F family protein [Verrucomicrobiota bacterium]